MWSLDPLLHAYVKKLCVENPNTSLLHWLKYCKINLVNVYLKLRHRFYTLSKRLSLGEWGWKWMVLSMCKQRKWHMQIIMIDPSVFIMTTYVLSLSSQLFFSCYINKNSFIFYFIFYSFRHIIIYLFG